MATTGSATAGLLTDIISYREFKLDDRAVLVEFIRQYIEEACPDLVASVDNAAVLFDMAGVGSTVAVDSKTGGLVGFTLLSPINHIQTKVRMTHSIGTYVIPTYRRRGIAEKLRRIAMTKIRNAGFKRIQGYTFVEDNTRQIKRLGGTIVGFVMETPVED